MIAAEYTDLARQCAMPTECYAVPGSDSIFDAIDAATGLTLYGGLTPEQVAAQKPGAVRMTLDAFCEAKAERQHTPITWSPIDPTFGDYDAMLECLPPACWVNGAFLVGEPTDHDAATGEPRFAGFRRRPSGDYCSSRPMTIREFRAEMAR